MYFLHRGPQGSYHTSHSLPLFTSYPTTFYSFQLLTHSTLQPFFISSAYTAPLLYLFPRLNSPRYWIYPHLI
jgi:hypothetical protein